MNVSALVHKEVFATMGVRIGRVTDAAYDEESWQLKTIEVELTAKIAEEFRLKRMIRKTRINVRVENVHGVADVVSLKLSKTELKQLLHANMALQKR